MKPKSLRKENLRITSIANLIWNWGNEGKLCFSPQLSDDNRKPYKSIY